MTKKTLADAEDVVTLAELLRANKLPLELAATLNLQTLNGVQRAMIAARLVDSHTGRHAGQTTVTVGRIAEVLRISRGSVQEARTILTKGTAEQIRAADAGRVPLHITGRQIRAQVPPELIRLDAVAPKSPGPGRISRMGESVYQRLAEEGPPKSLFRRRRAVDREPLPAPIEPPPAPSEPEPSRPEPDPEPLKLTLTETLRALIEFSSEYEFDEAVEIVSVEFDARELDHLITWLLEVHERALKAPIRAVSG